VTPRQFKVDHLKTGTGDRKEIVMNSADRHEIRAWMAMMLGMGLSVTWAMAPREAAAAPPAGGGSMFRMPNAGVPLFRTMPGQSMGGMNRPGMSSSQNPYNAMTGSNQRGNTAGSSSYSQMPSAGYGGSGNSGNAYPADAQDVGNNSQDDSRKRDVHLVLTASGVPSEGEQIRWPVGLRIVDTQEREGLRKQIDSLFEIVAQQAANGSIQPRVLTETAQVIDRLHDVLHRYEERGGITESTYAESDRFLQKLRHSLKVLQ
jgi:hypothetical protein